MPLRVMLLALLAVACGGGGASESHFIQGCTATSNLDPKMCECAARNAAKELSPEAFAFLAATLNQDSDTTEKLRHELAPDEMLQAGMFMVGAAADCAAELSE